MRETTTYFKSILTQVLVLISLLSVHMTLAQSVTGLTLVNADADTTLFLLADGDVINFQELPTTNLNVVANTTGTIGSISFLINNNPFSVENVAPYALAGDTNGNFKTYTPTLGSTQYKAVAYSSTGGNGTLLDSTSVTVTFIDEPVEILVTDVEFTNCPTTALTVGDVVDLDVLITPSNATNQTIAFTASDGTSVDYLSGEFTAQAAGVITVTATSFSDGSVFDECTITIAENQPTVDAYATIQAEDFSAQTGIQIAGNGNRVGYINNNDFIRFDNVEFGRGPISGTLAGSSNTSGGTVEFRTDAVNGPLLATVNVTNTGGWSTFQDFSINVPNAADYENGTLFLGTKNLFLVFKGGSGYLFDVDQFVFNSSEILVTDVSFTNCPSEPLNVGDIIDLDVVITPSNAVNQNVAFTASDGSSVDYLSGEFTASAPGDITVTVTSFSDGSVFDQCIITISDTIPPAAPSDLQGLALAPGEVLLSWVDNATNEQGFEIERTFDGYSTNPDWSLLATVSSDDTLFIDSTVALEEYASYRVRAINSVGNSSFSNTIQVGNQPIPPTNFRADSVSQTSITLAWDQSPYGNDYLIEFTNDLDSAFSYFDALYYGYEELEYTGLETGQTYFFRIRVNFDGFPSEWSDTLSVTTLSDLSALPVVLRINAGGPTISYGDSTFIADEYFAGNGKPYTNNNITDILGSSQDDIYKSERSTNASLQSFSYNIPVTNDEYSINLHFAEIYFGATGGGSGGTGKRVFNVTIEGETVLTDFDINGEVSPMTSLIKTYTTTVSDQELNISFSATVNQPKVSAIEVYGDGSLIIEPDSCTWNTLANSSLSKVEAQSVKVNDKMYVLAGFLSGLQITAATEIYDATTDTWSSGAPMPTAVTHMGAVAVGNEIWVLAGFVGNHPGVATDLVQIYNTVTDTWSVGPTLPNPRGSAAAAYSEGKIHFFGGLLPDRVTDVGEHYILDVNNQAAGWQAAAPMPAPRNHLSGAAVNGKIYAIGGQFGHDSGVQDQSFLHVYDPSTNAWTQLTNLPSARSHFEPGTIVHNDKIIIVGGRRGGFFFDDVTEYDPATNQWTERCELPTNLLAPAAKVFGDRLIVANGGENGTCCPTNETISIAIEPEEEFSDPLVSGELKKWHKVTVSFQGPELSETSIDNPFTDYRLNVTFTNGSKSYTVPGFYAANGNAANTSASTGNIWQVHFSPDEVGTWTYTASFRTADDIAIATSPTAGTAVAFDGATGSFNITASDKTGRDFRNTGRLEYVGEHYLRFAESGEYFFKVGADAPENTFAYEDFDATPNKSGRRKSWSLHAGDFDLADANTYTWGALQGDGARADGRELLGALKYLADQGMNVFSFLTFSLDGDDDNVYPHLQISSDATSWNNVHHDRFDVSKLAQWESILEYADKKGIYIHFKTQETENDQLMDGGQLGRERKLYYRELIARFGHHLALNWNLGEENDIWNELSDPNNDIVKSYAQYISDLDPYNHNIVIHTYPGDQDEVYDPLLGSGSELTGASVQSGINSIHNDVKRWVIDSRNAGKKWVVANDEQGGANSGVAVDASYPDSQLPEARSVSDNREAVRHRVLWGTMLAGGAGVEYYYGYQTGCDDLDCQDHRTRQTKWNDAKIALDFFNSYLRSHVTQMVSNDGLTNSTSDYVFAQEGEIYAIYLPSGGTTNLNLGGQSGNYQVAWYNPRNGGALQDGSVASVSGGSTTSIGLPPSDTTNDWVALITKEDTTPLRVLVYHETSGFRHGSIGAGIQMVEDFGSSNGWTVESSQSSNIFTTANLATADVVIWMNTSGDGLLTASEQAAFESYIQNGGGFVGVHAATDTYRNGSWPWYNELVGAIVQTSPNHTSNNYNATMDVVGSHPAVSHLGTEWNKSEEYYYWELNGGFLFSGNIDLLQVRSTGGQSYDAPRPITWYKEYDGGRSFYTALGHNAADYSANSNFITMMEQAILWAGGEINNPSARSAHAKLLGAEDELSELSIYPNPVEGLLTIQLGKLSSATVQLMDISGRTIQQIDAAHGEVRIDMSTMENGLYLLEIDSDGITKRIKILKK